VTLATEVAAEFVELDSVGRRRRSGLVLPGLEITGVDEALNRVTDRLVRWVLEDVREVADRE